MADWRIAVGLGVRVDDFVGVAHEPVLSKPHRDLRFELRVLKELAALLAHGSDALLDRGVSLSCLAKFGQVGLGSAL